MNKWVYKPNQFDDWGTIRDAETGGLVLKMSIPYSKEELDIHRENGTDPCEGRAKQVISIWNRRVDELNNGGFTPRYNIEKMTSVYEEERQRYVGIEPKYYFYEAID